ncbi:S24 family peptidase [Luteolibacter sp. GHJ8]|uniref:S24 family peptidase n=1 Tax=Luteolibacter rhizosphaerae TaxID=2989719 RepID=A0ABT3G1J0_9BACT|nr:S24 family peptidase [Luteolibacter rhizosphaerae]MCW1913699.1 S24 family peptidase [Luteolibacter rhizosphaerae]
MKDKKNTNLTVRLDDAMTQRLERFEKTTPIGRAEITRQALDAVLRHFEAHGKVVFPVEISPTEPDLANPSTAEAVERYMKTNQTALFNNFLRMMEEKNDKKINRFLNETVRLQREAGELAVSEVEHWPGEFLTNQTITLAGGVSAGEPVGKVGRRLLPTNHNFPPEYYALRVFGYRMFPIVSDGDIIIVRAIEKEMIEKDRIQALAVVRDQEGELQIFGYNRKEDNEWLVSFDLEQPPAPDVKDVQIEAFFVQFYSQGKRENAPDEVLERSFIKRALKEKQEKLDKGNWKDIY